MGNTESPKQTGMTLYERFGQVTVTEVDNPNLSSSDYKKSEMSFSRPVQSQNVVKEWQQTISRVDDSQTRDVLLIPEKHSFQKSGMCGSSGLVNLTYENFPFVLDIQIQNRKRMNSSFLETEMWYLLYNFIRAGNKFQKINKKIGDMHPHNVVINDDGQIKVISTCSIPGQLTNFQKVVENINEFVFLAPEEMNLSSISNGVYPNIDPCKAEVFSIGLTVLSSGLLEDCKSIYLNGYKEINQKLLGEYLAIFRQKYGNYLYNIVGSLLALNPKDRRKSSEVYKELVPFENNILQLQPFQNPNVNSQNRSSGYQPQSYGIPKQVQKGYGQSNQNINFNPSGYNVYQPY